jgi:hypothetical protein
MSKMNLSFEEQEWFSFDVDLFFTSLVSLFEFHLAYGLVFSVISPDRLFSLPVVAALYSMLK